MASVRIDVRANDTDALAKLNRVDSKLEEIRSHAASGLKLSLSSETRDVEGNIKRIVDTYKNAAGEIEKYTLAINKKGEASFSVTSQTPKKIDEVAAAYERAMAKQSAFSQISDAVFASYASGAMSAEQANKTFIKSIDEVAAARERAMAKESVFSKISDRTFADYASGLISAEEANKTLAKSEDVVVSSSSNAGNSLRETGKNASEAGRNAEVASNAFGLLHTIFLRLAHRAISQVTRAFRQSFTEMQNVDKQLTTVSRITQTSISNLDGLKEKAYDVGSAYGVMASDYLSGVAAFTRAGYREQAEDLAELSTKLQVAGEVSAETANQLLIATDKAYEFNGSVTKLSSVMDKMTYVDHNYATSVEKIAEGMGIVAPVAAQAHMSVDELIASLGTITAVTQRSGSESARALRALILSILKDTTTELEDGVTMTVDEVNSVQDALKKYAPEVVAAAEATGELINPMEAIAALSKSFEEGFLDEQGLAKITNALGGKLRSSQLLSLIQNFSGMYTAMMNGMGNSMGIVDKDMERYLDSWEGKLNQLKNTFTEFVEKSLSSDFIKGMIDAIKWIIEGFGSLGTVVGLLGAAFVALNITSVIGWFTQLGSSINALGGGFSAVITVLANYKTASQAGAVGTNAFNTALAGTSAAASGAQFAIGALIAIIGVAIFTFNKLSQSAEQRRKAQIDSAKTAAQEASELQKLKSNYEELQKSFEDGKITREDYETAQQAIIDKLKDEGVWASDTTDKYNDLTDAINASAEAALNSRKADIYGKLNSSKQQFIIDVIKNFPPAFADSLDYVLDIYSHMGAWDIFDVNDFVKRNPEQVLRAYDLMVAERDRLYSDGGKDSEIFQKLADSINAIEPFVESVRESYYEYLDLLTDSEIDDLWNKSDPFWMRMISDWENSKYKPDAVGEDIVKNANDISDSVEGLTDKLTTATAALDKYKKALEGGEKGDAFKSYAEAYKNAIELKEKGLTGSNAFMSAIDLLIPQDVMRELHYNYEKAGELLGNDFFKAMFEGGGEDFGVNAANYIREHIGEFEGVEVAEAEGKFALLVKDVEAFAKSANISTDTAYALLGALDMLGSTATYTNEQFDDLFRTYANGIMMLDEETGKRTLPLEDFINNLAAGGKTEREIYQIIDAVRHLAETDASFDIIEPENIDEIITKAQELQSETDDGYEINIESNIDDAVAQINSALGSIERTIVVDIVANYIGFDDEGDEGNNGHRKRSGHQQYASGTESARGGTALVNEEGAEIIYANGSAWVAGGGQPTITNLPIGAKVFNADQTREIFSRSGINSFESTPWIPIQPSKDILGGKKLTKNIEKILDELSKYIDDILKKAKKALDKQLKAIDEQIEALEKEHNAEEEKNKLEELRLNILEAEKKLAEAQNERTVRYFNKETGQWEWMADQKAVHEAEQALKEAQEAYDKEVAEQEYQAKLQELNDQKEALQKQYDDLAEHWEEILEAIQEAGKEDVDFEEILKKLGLSGEVTDDIRKLIEAILNYEKQLTDGTYDIPLDDETANRIMGGSVVDGSSGDTLTKLIGLSGGDMNAKGTSIYNSNITNTTGDVNYYINGLQIGSDMMDRPLSDILSVLPIYAN